MSKKIWSLISLLLVATLLLAACGGGAAQTQAPAATDAPAATEEAPAATEEAPAATEEAPAATEEAPAAGEGKTIQIWHQWTGDYLTAISAVFDAYMAEHPDVTIELTNPEDVQNALKVAIPAGQGPDIIGWANDHIGDLALQGFIVPLDTLGVDQAFLESTFEPAAVAGVVWQGQIWGLPESQEGIAIVYNKALASAEDFPTDPADFAGLVEKAKAFQEANPGVWLLCNQGLGNKDAYHIAPIYFGHGVPTYVDDEGNVYLNTPESLAAANWMLEFKPYAPAETSHDICKANITEGKAAAWWTGPWAIADLETAGIDYGILPFGKPFVGIKNLMITSNAVDRGNAEVALDIIKFFTNAENSKAIALANKTIPANTAALNDPEIQGLATLAGFGAALNSGIPMANTPFASAQWDPVGDSSVAIWNGSQTPEEALAAGQSAAEAKVAEMK